MNRRVVFGGELWLDFHIKYHPAIHNIISHTRGQCVSMQISVAALEHSAGLDMAGRLAGWLAGGF